MTSYWTVAKVCSTHTQGLYHDMSGLLKPEQYLMLSVSYLFWYTKLETVYKVREKRGKSRKKIISGNRGQPQP